MGSPYATGSAGSGSPYATGTAGAGSPYAGGGSSNKPPKKKSGGILGGLESGFHWTAAKASLAGHDLKAMPGGAVQAATTFGKDTDQALHKLGTSLGLHPATPADKKPVYKKTAALGKAYVEQTKTVVEHPLRDPFLTAVSLAPFFKVAGGAALRGGAAVKVARAGEGPVAVVKAAAKKPVIEPRLIAHGDAQIPLHASANPAVRLVQAGYDKVIQHALNTNPDSRLGSHATKRLSGSLAETERYRTRMRETPASVIEATGVKLGPRKLSPRRAVSGLVPRKVQEAALRLTSENSTAQEVAAFHRGQAQKGVALKPNLKQARLYDQVAKHGLLTQDEHGNVIVDAAAHPNLAVLDAHIAEGQAQVDEIAKAHDLMTEEQLQARRNGPARIRNGAIYEEPTPGKAGVPSQALLRQRSQVARLEQLHGRALARAADNATAYPNVHTTPSGLEKAPGPRTPGAPSDMVPAGTTNPITDRLGAALSVARDRLQSMEAAAAGRVKPTGIVGGESARPGRGFVTYRTLEPKAPKNQVAGSSGPVVGKVKSFISRQPFTGHGLELGKVPDNTSRLVAQHMRDAYRYVNTDSYRRTVLTTGSDARRTSRDVLVRNPDAEHVAQLSPNIEDLIGRKQLTVGELDGVKHGFEAWRQTLVPGLAKDFADERASGIGTAAPEGYKWVDRNILGDLGKPGPGPRNVFGRAADKINTSVTAATVYFKLGHVGTRVFTNAATNIVQGSAKPTEIAKSLDLWHALTPEERLKGLAVGGQGGFHALPLTDETGVLSKAISGAGRIGANWWAKHADAPFRFNSVAYEARKAGIDTPEKFRVFLHQLENPEGLNAAQAAKIDWIAKRANREGIAYDRLSHFERQYITRAFWFYPWVAGASRFAINTLMEHPYKAAAIANVGAQGRQQQAIDFGPVPSYEGGLFKLAGSGDHPLAADFSTFSPFATPADVLETGSFGSASEFLNPAYAALLQLATRQNQYGQHTNTPLTDAGSALVSPTPESQIITAYLHRHQDQSKRMFHKTWQNQLARAAVGPGLPRHVSRPALNSAAARQLSGR